MSRFKSATWKAAIRRQNIAAYYRYKAAAELIPENENVFVPRSSGPDVVVTIKIKGQPQMQFSSYKLPHGNWTISPTLAGKKVQQVLMRA
jgi:hypothetical protein